MNDRTFDSDDPESQDPDEGEQRSLEDRWRRFLTGEADEERRLRMEKRRDRIREERDPEQDRGEETKTEGSGEEETAEEPAVGEDPSEPRTRAEELRILGKDRPGAADPGGSVDPGTPAPGPDEKAPREVPEQPPAANRDAPVVIPAKDAMDLPAWRRYWKPVAAGVALLLIAILAVRGVGGGGGATPDEGASPAGAEAASAVEVDRAEALTDSLEAALGRYRERKQDFDLDRLDCAGLARGYEEVRSVLGELRSAVPYADDLAAGPLRSRYRSLVSSVETVEEGYADTGCAGSA